MLIKKSITLKKHRTSLSLEIEFWEALNKIAETEKSSIQSLISEIDINRKSSLASSTRVFILQYYKHI
jgi:predicted DNA-binding ribbon-helix-helix protein